MRFVHYFVLVSTWVVSAFVGAACGDDFGPINWSDVPDTLQIFSLSRSDLRGLPSAYNGVELFAPLVIVETGTDWDFALAEPDSGFVMLPQSAVAGGDSTAALATIGEVTLDEVTEAPPNADFVTEPVPIVPGTVYVLRTRREVCNTITTLSGPRFGKIEAIAVDEEEGTFDFAVVLNPNCNDRALIPPDDS